MSQDEYVYYFDLQDLEPLTDASLDKFEGSESSKLTKLSTESTEDIYLPSVTQYQKGETTLPEDFSAPDSILRETVGPDLFSPSSATISPNSLGSNTEPRDSAQTSFTSSESVSVNAPTSQNQNKTTEKTRAPTQDVARPTGTNSFLDPRNSTDTSQNRVDDDQSFSNRGRLLSVHALGQFVFCNRSGIYSAEVGDETEFDEPTIRLDYVPNFELERIEERLSQLIRQFLISTGLVVILVLAGIGCVAFQNRTLFNLTLVVTLMSIYWPAHLMPLIGVLAWRRMAALRAPKCEPPLDINRIESVNWWSMLKSGFESRTYQRQFRHPRLPLEGCPWRVLERGSLRIPAIRSGSTKLGDRKHSIYGKHEVRLGAYAMLLEAIEHVKVPYGIVFPSDSPHGLAIPITDSLRNSVTKRISEFSESLIQSQQRNIEPSLPTERKRCLNCDLGNPVLISDSEIQQAKKNGGSLRILEQASGRKFHCRCGDRFGSIPSHGKSLRLGLKASLE